MKTLKAKKATVSDGTPIKAVTLAKSIINVQIQGYSKHGFG